ncbi:hypothetical protein CC78DRAFT_569107 [Lojkania enalia]|uniref:Zn(2)-C6 fungal-type domain-containing protein n=1 Tax=Lojkania enalia TaxID=147567 RepID=A0A9P4K642_9PLEO|nr:hypothetical protein CC78DRAFT_569107 [Didymosphaeria enalia]
MRKTNTNLILRSALVHYRPLERRRLAFAQTLTLRIIELPERNPRHQMCPYTPLPASDGPSRFSPSSVRDWQPRRKSVSNACERCRRRKIRCDGDTPCATCKRFSLQCVRIQKPREAIASEHQAALENRIHQLEAQLAAHVGAPTHGMESIGQSLMAGTSNFDWQSPPPQLALETNFPAPYSPESELDLATFSAGGIPSIAITECESTPNDSPCSSVPSFWSGTTRASSPDTHRTPALQFQHNFAGPSNTATFPPSLTPTPASWDFMEQDNPTHLKPHPDLSRRSSVSSSSMDSDDHASSELDNDADILPLGPMPRLPRQGIFAASTESPPSGVPRSSHTDRNRAINVTPFPSRFEAETLTTEFAQHIQSFEHKPYTIPAALFRQLCEVVYPDPKKRSSSVDLSISVPMARFHVFLAMAIGMKIRILESTESTNSLLDRCYELAIQQASSPTFWQENGGVEAAQLLTVFASLKNELGLDPKPLQTSFSWAIS